MALNVKSDVIAHLPVTSVVSGDCALLAVVNAVGFDVAAFHISTAVCMSAVAAEIKCLATSAHFGVFNPHDAAHHRDCMYAEQLTVAAVIALNDDIA